MTDPTNKDLAEALRAIEGLPLGTALIVRLAADRLSEGDGWIAWDGAAGCPVPEKTPLIVKYRCGIVKPTTAGDQWSHDWAITGHGYDIIAYRIVK